MEKRFLAALFLSLLVMSLWVVLFAPEPEETPVDPETGEPVVELSDLPGGAPVDDGPAPEPPDPSELVSEVIEGDGETRTVEFGAAGEQGHVLARFDSIGGRLLELKFGEYVVEGTPADRRHLTENWLPLLSEVEPVRGNSGSLRLETIESSAALSWQPLEDAPWKVTVEPDPEAPDDPERAQAVVLRYDPGQGLTFTKRFERIPGTWDFRFTLSIENSGLDAFGRVGFRFVPASCVPAELGDGFYAEPNAVAVGPIPEEGQRPDYDLDQEHGRASKALGEGASGELGVPGPLAFVGAHNKYFALLLRPDPESEAARNTLRAARYQQLLDATWIDENPGRDPRDAPGWVEPQVHLELTLPDKGESASWSYLVYAGPKSPEIMRAQDPAFGRLFEKDLGFFSGIGKVLLTVMRFFHGITGNWGVAIILMTILLRSVLFPLNRRSQTAMARYQTKMKRVQPKLDEIKKKHANDQQKQRQEQARIMQEEGAFPPLGGCLPVFFQIPIFFALFGMLRTNFDLRQEPFAAWIRDLSQPDRMFRIDLELPLVGSLEYFNLLPILMVILWVVQQMGMPKPADEQAQRMQRMMMFMPVVMGVFLYNYAAGLSLYMMTQSGLGIVEQRVIKKLWPVDDTEVERKPGKGCGPFSGFVEKIAEQQKEQMKRMQQAQREREKLNKKKQQRRKR